MGRPKRFSRSCWRRSTSGERRPRRRLMAAAAVIPIATASPWRKQSYSVAASMAWPTGWAELGTRRLGGGGPRGQPRDGGGADVPPQGGHQAASRGDVCLPALRPLADEPVVD